MNIAVRGLCEKYGQLFSFGRGKQVFAPKQKMSEIGGLLCVKNGVFKILSANKSIIIDVRINGEILNEEYIAGKDRTKHYCIAMEDYETYRVSRNIIFQSSIMSGKLLTWMAQRLCAISHRLVIYSCGTIKHRVAACLMYLVDKFGLPIVTDGREISIRVTHSDIAQMIGAARENVTSELTRLKELGVISAERYHIKVLKFSTLEETVKSIYPLVPCDSVIR